RFDPAAVVECEIVHLKWHQLHASNNLVLLFHSMDEYLDRPNVLVSLWNAASRFQTLQCKLAVICRDDEFEILTWMNRLSAEIGPKPIGFPVIIDADHEIASIYDMLSVDGLLWGHVLADSKGRVRSIAARAFPLRLNVEELVKYVAAIVESDDA
ncbi:MAG: redoxin domain-containing protein, partial [Planctomycetota bacterium]